jgi:hypothetical protein
MQQVADYPQLARDTQLAIAAPIPEVDLREGFLSIRAPADAGVPTRLSYRFPLSAARDEDGK